MRVFIDLEDEGKISKIEDKVITDKKEALELLESTYGMAFDMLSDELKNDEEILLSVLEEFPGAIEDADKLKNDRNFILKAIEVNGEVLSFLDKKFKEDKELIFKAVKSCPFVIADLNIKDEEIIKKAIEINEAVLEYIDD